MSLSFMGRTLRCRPLHEPFRELAASTVVVEPQHVAVVVDLLDGATRALVVGAGTSGNGEVILHRDRLVRSVIGALGVSRRGALVLALPEPRFDHGIPPRDRLVV